MKYTGRIISIFTPIILLAIIKLYVYYNFEYIHYIFIMYIYILYTLGKKYDFYAFTATKDSLTQMYTRHYVVQHFNKYLNYALKKNGSLCIFMIDCNNFKYINDNYGHLTGDLTLKELSKIFTHCNKLDISSRWGGDEFLLLKSRKFQEQYIAEINIINTKVRALSRKLDIDISVSIGIHTSYKKITLNDAISLADSMMYQEKKRVKNSSAFKFSTKKIYK